MKGKLMQLNKISIITITYNPNIEELQSNLKSYIQQSQLIVIVDNSTDIKIQMQIKHLMDSYNNIHVLTLGDNFGIAKAQNIGFKYAIDNGYDYFIEMDQDSQLPNNYVENIYKSYLNILSSNKYIAGIGPIAINKQDNSSYHYRDTSEKIIEVEKTLSSGFFTSKQVLEKVGFKDENLFIDLVDWEWCWRARSKEFNIFVDTTLKIQHLLGEGHKKFYFFKLGIPSPIRHYYQYRNSLLLSKKNYIPLKWKIKRFFIHLLKPIFFLVLYDKKIERLKFVCKGLMDGFLGKKGKIK